MLNFKFFGQGMKNDVFKILAWLKILDRHALSRQYFCVTLRHKRPQCL